MPLNWSDFSSDSGTPDVPLLLSIRSQSLALSAVYYIQFAHRWANPDASEWDEIEGAISECLNELMEIAMPDFTPVGTIVAFTDIEPPAKWLLCNGGTFPTSGFPELFDIIGYKYGGSGANFDVPDLRERFIYGHRNDGGGDAVMDEIGGAATHTLTTAELPAHSHIQRGKNTVGGAVFHSQVNATSTAGGSVATTTPTSDSGGGGAHNNMPPFHSLAYIIKALP